MCETTLSLIEALTVFPFMSSEFPHASGSNSSESHLVPLKRLLTANKRLKEEVSGSLCRARRGKRQGEKSYVAQDYEGNAPESVPDFEAHSKKHVSRSFFYTSKSYAHDIDLQCNMDLYI